MNKIRNYWKNKKGITLVWGAFFLVLCLMFLGLAVDIAYMYVVKNQLQVAADAAALAGAAELDGTNSTTQTEARDKAVEFASKNSAAGSAVVLASDGNNTLTNTNDITVGNWNANLSPKYLAGRTPINAVEVRPRRTANSPGGPVGVFVGQVFRYIGSDWSLMSASASAIANMPVRASEFIALCTDACAGCIYPSDPCPLSPVREISKDNCSPGSCGANAAWTSLLTQPTGPGFNLNDLICTVTPNVNVCVNPIWTTNGEDAVAQRNFEADMYDPSFDSEAKMCLSSTGVIGKCSEVSGAVQSWEIMVPVTADCPPGRQGQGPGWDPKPVWGYAIIRVVTVCEQGGGNPCNQQIPPNGRPYSAPQNACDLYENLTIVIDQIQCVSCDDAEDLFGRKPHLVK